MSALEFGWVYPVCASVTALIALVMVLRKIGNHKQRVELRIFGFFRLVLEPSDHISAKATIEKPRTRARKKPRGDGA